MAGLSRRGKRDEQQGTDLLPYLHNAMEILAKGAPSAAQSLVDLSTTAKSEFVRMQASTAVLSRVGINEAIDVSLFAKEPPGTTEKTAVELLQMRLDTLRNQTLAAARDEAYTAAAAAAEDGTAEPGDPDPDADLDVVTGMVLEATGTSNVFQFPAPPTYDYNEKDDGDTD